MTLRECIQLLQKTAEKHHFHAIVVGGAVVRLFSSKTAIKKIDEEKRMILLENAENPGIGRSEDTKTTVDIDCIAFSTHTDSFSQETRSDFDALQKDLRNLAKQYNNFPAVSLEPVLYHPYFSHPNTLMQFVSSIESYHDNNFFFRLGGIKEDVQTKSLEPWTLTFTDSNDIIITFMPSAVQKRYGIRGFSIKPKDKEKIFGQNAPFAEFVANFRIKTKGKYDKLFIEWDTFADRIQHTKQPSMKAKKALWNAYWQTIGTYLAHGTGFIGKLLLPLGNTFFAGK